jgi:hypothetical protein
MSHRHFCDFAGHYWECEGSAVRQFAGDTEPTVCLCLNHHVPLERGDHSECSIELLACPSHRMSQLQRMNEEAAEEKESDLQAIGPHMQKDGVPIQVPENLEEMLEAWTSYAGENVGWCLLCNGPIHTEADMIPGTNTHDCEQGRAFESGIEL